MIPSGYEELNFWSTPLEFSRCNAGWSLQLRSPSTQLCDNSSDREQTIAIVKSTMDKWVELNSIYRVKNEMFPQFWRNSSRYWFLSLSAVKRFIYTHLLIDPDIPDDYLTPGD